MKNLLSALLFLLAAQPLFACGVNAFTIAPARPTTSDDIEVVLSGGCPDGCIPHTPRVRVAAGTITIDLQAFGACILIPLPWGERVDVGRVPAGSYEVVVNRAGKEMARRMLVVREHPFEVEPSFGFEGMRVLLGVPHREVAKVEIGGVNVPFELLPEGVAITVPKHAPGLLDIVVTADDATTLTATQAFRYPEPQADLTTEHERVFFPSVFAGPGAHGSRWNSYNAVVNRGPIEVDPIPPLTSVLNPVPVPAPLLPGARTILGTEGRDGGLLVLVPAGVEDWLAYSSRIADDSRRQNDAGTELPVVHERETADRIDLVNVPLTAESRQTLRIFDFDAVDGRKVTVWVKVDGRDRLVTLGATLTGRIVCVTTPCYPQHPTFAVINLDAVPELRGAGSADISVYAATKDAPLWAYVTVTNNETQHVTAVTPQHRRRSLP